MSQQAQEISITDRRAWSVKEAAKTYSVSPGFLRRQIRAGALRARRIGRRVLLLDEDVRMFFEGGGK